MKKTVKIIIIVLAALILAGGAAGGVFYYSYQQEKKEAEKIADPAEAEEGYQKMQETVVKKAEDPYESKIDFEELQMVNQDVYVWIQIPDTNVDYPILQSVVEEDEYYLNTTIDGKTGLPGSIYT